MPDDFYDLLGVDDDASPDEVKEAYREMVRRYHPDVNDDERAHAQFKVVRIAYDVLSDPDERDVYDRLGHERYVDRRLDGLPTTSPPERHDAADDDGSDAVDTDYWARSGNEGIGGVLTSRTDGGHTGAGAGAGGRAATGGAAAGRRERRRARSRSGLTDLGLEAGWLAVFLACVVYAVGLASYWVASGTTARRAVVLILTDPALAVAGPAGDVPPSPGAFAAAAVDAALALAPGVDLLFPLGAVLLPAALGWTVLRFGKGAAWVYVACAFGPLVALLVGPALPLSTTAVVASLVVVVPLAGALVFLGDVGRFVVATREFL